MARSHSTDQARNTIHTIREAQAAAVVAEGITFQTLKKRFFQRHGMSIYETDADGKAGEPPLPRENNQGALAIFNLNERATRITAWTTTLEEQLQNPKVWRDQNYIHLLLPQEIDGFASPIVFGEASRTEQLYTNGKQPAHVDGKTHFNRKDLVKPLGDGTPIPFAYTSGGHWYAGVLIGSQDDNGPHRILWVDSFGEPPTEELQKRVKEYFQPTLKGEIEFISSTHQQQYDGHSCGQLAALNLQTLLGAGPDVLQAIESGEEGAQLLNEIVQDGSTRFTGREQYGAALETLIEEQHAQIVDLLAKETAFFRNEALNWCCISEDIYKAQLEQAHQGLVKERNLQEAQARLAAKQPRTSTSFGPPITNHGTLAAANAFATPVIPASLDREERKANLNLEKELFAARKQHQVDIAAATETVEAPADQGNNLVKTTATAGAALLVAGVLSFGLLFPLILGAIALNYAKKAAGPEQPETRIDPDAKAIADLKQEISVDEAHDRYTTRTEFIQRQRDELLGNSSGIPAR